jgi:hypothetical protein
MASLSCARHGLTAQRHSALAAQINTGNVGKPVAEWTQSRGNNLGPEAMPVLRDGVLYRRTHDSTVAIDALSRSLAPLGTECATR